MARIYQATLLYNEAAIFSIEYNHKKLIKKIPCINMRQNLQVVRLMILGIQPCWFFGLDRLSN
jgi:hypothetical protein